MLNLLLLISLDIYLCNSCSLLISFTLISTNDFRNNTCPIRLWISAVQASLPLASPMSSFGRHCHWCVEKIVFENNVLTPSAFLSRSPANPGHKIYVHLQYWRWRGFSGLVLAANWNLTTIYSSNAYEF